MYSSNAFYLYLDSTYKNPDVGRLKEESHLDGLFIRAAYVPSWDYDKYQSNYDGLKEDPAYKGTFAAAKALNLPKIAVIEMNSSLDKDTNWRGKIVFGILKEIFKAGGDFVPDAFVLKVDHPYWIENGKTTYNTASNERYAVTTLLADLYNEFRKTVFVWSRAGVLKSTNMGGNNYAHEFVVAADEWNDTGSFPIGFSYVPPYMQDPLNGLRDRTLVDLRQVAGELRVPTTEEINTNLRIGSYSGWGAKDASNKPVHGFWGFDVLNYHNALRDATGNLKRVQTFIFDTDAATLNAYLPFNPVVQPPPDSAAPSVPTNLKATLTAANTVQLTWDAATDDTGVDGYTITRNGVDFAPSSFPAYHDTGVAPGTTYSYQVEAYDAAGNHSGESEPVTITTGGGEPVPGMGDLEALVAKVVARMDEIAVGNDALLALLKDVFGR